MNGFKPFGDIKNWHLLLLAVLAVTGAVAIIVGLIYSIYWLINHIQIIIK